MIRRIADLIVSLSCIGVQFNVLMIPPSSVAQVPWQLDLKDSDRPAVCPLNLAASIEQIVNRPELARSRWGIEIQTDTESLYSLNADKFFTPASATKLLTSAAGLLELGADYQIKTAVYGVGKPSNLTSLRLLGKGDPSLSTVSLKSIVHQLQLRGVKQIKNLIIDDSYFGQPTINPTWEWIDVHSYFATAVNSTILNQNTVTLTLLPQKIGQPVKFVWHDAIAAKQWQVVNQAITGEADIDYNIELDGDLGKPVLRLLGELAVNEPPDVWDLAVVDPSQYFLDSWRSQLELAGIMVNRGSVIHQPNWHQNKLETELAAIYSPPLSQIVKEINRSSNNLYAEALGKLLAKELDVKNSVTAIEQSLTKIGVQPDEYVLVDASGLSRQNLIPPQTLVKVLNLMSRSPVAESYRQSLAVAGINGTLKRRFQNTSIKGNLWGKTGTLTGIGTLAGYLSPQDYPPIVFSIMVNNSELKSSKIRQAIDEIVVILNHMQKC